MTITTQYELNNANPNTIADALRRAEIGSALSPIKVTFAGLTSAAAVNITTAASRAAATIVGRSPEISAGETLPPIGAVVSLRVTAGAAAAAPRGIVDTGGSASATYAKISDDGATLTFETTVTGFVLTYFPRAAHLLEEFQSPAP